MSLFGLKFSQMILHTETSKLMYNWSFLFEVLHKPTLLPCTFNCYHLVGFLKCAFVMNVFIESAIRYIKQVIFFLNYSDFTLSLENKYLSSDYSESV